MHGKVGAKGLGTIDIYKKKCFIFVNYVKTFINVHNVIKIGWYWNFKQTPSAKFMDMNRFLQSFLFIIDFM